MAAFVRKKLSQLLDVLITGPTNGQALVYDTASGKWKNGTATGSGSVAVTDGVETVSPASQLGFDGDLFVVSDAGSGHATVTMNNVVKTLDVDATVTDSSDNSGLIVENVGDAGRELTIAPQNLMMSLRRTGVKTGNYTAHQGQLVPVDTSSGNVTVTLPDSTGIYDQAIVAVKMIGQASSHTVTIATAGSDVLNKTGGPTSVALTALNQVMFFHCDEGSAVWTVIAEAGAPSSTTVTVNTQTASYTLVLADAGLVVEMNVGSANNLTVPPNSSVAFPIGTVIELSQVGAGLTTVVAGAGVTIDSLAGSLALAGQYAAAALRKRATNEWVLVGGLA